MAKNEPRDGLDLENLTELEVHATRHTWEEIEAFGREIDDEPKANMLVARAMGCTWWCHPPMATDFRYRDVVNEQQKILEFIFGPGSESDLIDKMFACGENNRMIGEKLIEYARLHGYEKELPDDLRKGSAGQDAADAERSGENGKQ